MFKKLAAALAALVAFGGSVCVTAAHAGGYVRTGSYVQAASVFPLQPSSTIMRIPGKFRVIQLRVTLQNQDPELYGKDLFSLPAYGYTAYAEIEGKGVVMVPNTKDWSNTFSEAGLNVGALPDGIYTVTYEIRFISYVIGYDGTPTPTAEVRMVKAVLILKSPIKH